MSTNKLLLLYIGLTFLTFVLGEFRDNKSVMMVVDKLGDLSIFWIAHKEEQDKCKVNPTKYNFNSDQKGNISYDRTTFTTGVVLKDMILVCGGLIDLNSAKTGTNQSQPDFKLTQHPSNKCWYWHRDEPPASLKLLGKESSIPISEDDMDPGAKGQVLMASTFTNGNYVKDKFEFYVLVLATFDGIKSKKYRRHFFGGKIDPRCVNGTIPSTSGRRAVLKKGVEFEYNKDLQQSSNGTINKKCTPTVSWTTLTPPNWDNDHGIEFPCVVYYGKHFIVLGVSKDIRMPEWGAMVYDSENDTWNNFALPGYPKIKLPGRPRNNFACGIYRNNLMFSGGIYSFDPKEEVRSVANDTHLFNIRYYKEGNFWNPQYQVASMDDGNGKDCEVCPLWSHTIAIIQDINREVMFAAFGCTDNPCHGNNKIYQYDQTYGMTQGKWVIVRDSPNFNKYYRTHIGLTIPMTWIRDCADENNGPIITLHAIMQIMIVFGVHSLFLHLIDSDL